jgi:hypothetical protein
MCRIYLNVCCVVHGDVSAIHCDMYRVSVWINTLIRTFKTDVIVQKHI